MIIKDAIRRIKCEMPNCKNIASIKIEKEGFFRSAGIHICDECVEELYKALSQRVVPKSPNNMLNKKIISKEKKSEEK